MKRKLLFLNLLALLTSLIGYGQNHHVTETIQPQGKTVVFRFVAGDDTFFIPYRGNGDKLNELVATIDHYKGAIINGQATINVAGYCSSYATAKENLQSAAVRANRVKSELIIRNGIKEEHFHTTVHAAPFEGYKSVVVVTLRVPQISEPVAEKPAPEPIPDTKPVEQPKQEPAPQPVVEEAIEVILEPVAVKNINDYHFALRTNLLYDAMLVPNLGIEWRANESMGVKVDAGGSYWGKPESNVQKMWYVNPELRYYMGSAKRFYAGVGGNYGKYNIYKGMLGNLISKDTGYQGTMWNAGIVGGYQLPLGRSFALDFNLGLGYNSFSYDSFNLIDEVRVYKDRDQTKNSFGITQAGISLVWKICK